MSQSYIGGVISGTMTPLTGQVTGYVEYLVVAGGGGGGGQSPAGAFLRALVVALVACLLLLDLQLLLVPLSLLQ